MNCSRASILNISWFVLNYFSWILWKQWFLYIYVRTVQELFLNNSSRTVLEKFLKENGLFNVQGLFLHSSRTVIIWFSNCWVSFLISHCWFPFISIADLSLLIFHCWFLFISCCWSSYFWLGNLCIPFSCMLIFFKSAFWESECQTVCIQIRPDVLFSSWKQKFFKWYLMTCWPK